MGEPKPTASLSGMLLARKGAARPAMRRPSMMGNHSNAAVSQDDLGWNDMGYDVDPAPNAPMDYDHDNGYNPLAGAVPEVRPDVRQLQERIAEQLQVQAEAGFESLLGDEPVRYEQPFSVPPLEAAIVEVAIEHAVELEIEPVASIAPTPVFEAAQPVQPAFKPMVSATKPRAAKGSKEKAAFTLRLDAERHLKLRLACAVNNRSAQMLVTDALDAFLDAMPEIGQLVDRVPGR
jgi:hypothetical protein